MATNISVYGLAAASGVKQISLTWTTNAPGCSGSGGLPYLGAATVQVWASATNNRNAATHVGSSATGIFLDSGLTTSQTRYYWIRPVDASGQIGAYYPVSLTGGVVGTTQSEIPPDNSVGTTQIAANAVTGTQVANGAITTSKLTALCVTAANIAANSVYANAIQANAVTAGKIAAASISADRIDANGISANQIKTGTLDAGLITVTNLNANNITAGTLTANRIAVLDSSNLVVGAATNITSTSGATHTFTSAGGSHLIIATIHITSNVVTNIPFPQATVQLYLDSGLRASQVVLGYVGFISGSNYSSQLTGTAVLVLHTPLTAGAHTADIVVANVTAGVTALPSNPYIISFESRR